MKNLFFSLIFLICGFSGYATHLLGGEITYEHVSNNTYIIKLNLIWEQSLGFDPGNSKVVYVSSAVCDFSTSISLNKSTSYPLSSYYNCIDSTGLVPMVNEYTGMVNLNQPCMDYVFSYSECCRIGGISNLITSMDQEFYFFAELNNTLGTNSAPSFNVIPMSGYCKNTAINANFSVTDMDGDSLFYELVPAYQNDSLFANYDSAYSPVMPFTVATGDTILLNPASGILSFTPRLAENSVVAIKVTEYRYDPLYMSYYPIGSCMRDFLISISDFCTPDALQGVLFSSATPGYDQSKSTIASPVIDLNCGDSLIEVRFKNHIATNSIAADGTDFFIINPNKQVASIQSISFTATGNVTDVVYLHLLDPLCESGIYKLLIKVGNDGNSLYTECGIDNLPQDTAYLIVDCGTVNIVGNLSPLPGVNEAYTSYFNLSTGSPVWSIVNGTILGGQGNNAILAVFNSPISSCKLSVTHVVGNCTFSKTLDFGAIGLDENSSFFTQVFPNPATGSVTFDFGEVIPNSIEIINSYGQRMDMFNPTTSSVIYSLSGLTAGLYYIRVNSLQGNEYLSLLVQ